MAFFFSFSNIQTSFWYKFFFNYCTTSPHHLKLQYLKTQRNAVKRFTLKYYDSYELLPVHLRPLLVCHYLSTHVLSWSAITCPPTSSIGLPLPVHPRPLLVCHYLSTHVLYRSANACPPSSSPSLPLPVQPRPLPVCQCLSNLLSKVKEDEMRWGWGGGED